MFSVVVKRERGANMGGVTFGQSLTRSVNIKGYRLRQILKHSNELCMKLGQNNYKQNLHSLGFSKLFETVYCYLIIL